MNSSSSTSQAAERPNVILIMADDMGYGDLSCLNGGLSETPNLDALYQSSLRLSQGYSAAPVCAPSRAGFLTGRYPIRTGCTDLNNAYGLNELALDEVTIADMFQAAGYRTGLVGKWHCGIDGPYRPQHRGFQEVDAYHPRGNQSYWDWEIDRNGETIESKGQYLTSYMTERALDFVDRAKPDEPFFLHLAYYAPHRPLQAPKELVDKYLNNGKGLTKGQATVYAMIEVMDDGIGELMQKLEEKGLRDNTIVVFTSDNGPDYHESNGLSPDRFNLNLKGHKYLVYEGGIRVPFIVSWPAELEPGQFDPFFHFVDVLPTIADACSVPVPEGVELDGVSYLQAWKGEADAPEVERYWQWNRYYPSEDCNLAMRAGEWKLVLPPKKGYQSMTKENLAMLRGEIPVTVNPPERDRDLGPAKDPELYSIPSDPTESRDLAKQNPEKVKAMNAKMDAWFTDVRADLDGILDKRFTQDQE